MIEQESFEIADLEDKKPEFDNIDLYDCPLCGGEHRFHNGAPTLAPIVFECRGCGEPIEDGISMDYCSRSCRRKSLREAAEKMEELLS